jgi:four helix bundle protein
VKDYRDLEVWQRSHKLVLFVYAVTRQFPKDEQFGITSQLRRARASIPANLAEGCGRDSDAELKRFIDIAHGSAAETEYFLRLAHDLGIMSAAALSGGRQNRSNQADAGRLFPEIESRPLNADR